MRIFQKGSYDMPCVKYIEAKRNHNFPTGFLKFNLHFGTYPCHRVEAFRFLVNSF